MLTFIPNKHLLAIATYLSLLPLVFFLPKLLNPYLPENELARLMLLLAIIVPIVSYIILPSVVKALKYLKSRNLVEK
jgi:antibiotic biosynthesis monooxygenase (ABM) superfamily enzyme